MVIKIDESIIRFSDIKLKKLLNTVINLSQYHKDAFLISSDLLIDLIDRFSLSSMDGTILRKLKRIDNNYSTIMSIHSDEKKNYICISNNDDELHLIFFFNGNIHYQSDITEEDFYDKMIRINFYFENQSDGEFLESVINTKYNSNHLFDKRIIQPGGGTTIIKKYSASLMDNMLWIFIIDNDICIDNLRISHSNARRCEDLEQSHYSLSLHLTTISRTIENLVPKEIIDSYLNDYKSNENRYLFDLLLANKEIYKGYNFKEGVRKDFKNSSREELKQLWREKIGIECTGFSIDCIDKKFCSICDFSDVLFNGVSSKGHNLIEYAINKINEGINFNLKGDLQLLTNIIYKLTAANKDLSLKLNF